MPIAKVYDMTGKHLGDMELNDAVFGIEPSNASMHTVVRAHLAARRQGTQSALTRAEVSGGGIKPWRQKGTGRARQGSTRSPQWTHGGIVFAPKPRDYRFHVNKKIRRLAMKSALSVKAGAGEIILIEKLELNRIKTKDFIDFLANIGINSRYKLLVVIPEVRETVIKSARNIPGVKTTLAGTINVYDIINSNICIMDKSAVEMIEGVYAQ